MLSITSILARVKHGWINLPPTILLSGLLSYSRVYVTIQDSSTSQTIQCDINDLQGLYNVSMSYTLEQIISNYTISLPNSISPILDLTKKKTINYYSLWDYLLNARGLDNTNQSLSYNQNNIPDIVITPDLGFTNSILSLQNKILFVINGLIQDEVWFSDHVLIPKGGLEINTMEEQSLGVLDFSSLGGFNKVHLNTSNVSIFNEMDLATTVHITLDNPVTTDLCLVLNGRMYFFDEIFTLVDRHTVAIRLDHLSIIKEAYTAELTTLDWIDRIAPDSTGFDVTTFNALTYMTRGNSFLLILPIQGLSVEECYLEASGLPTFYLANGDVRDIVFLEDGTIANYVINEVQSEYNTILSVSSPRVYHSVSDTTKWSNLPVTNGSYLSPSFQSQKAKLRKIYSL